MTDKSMTIVDGSFGEGGGQILRTTIGLSLLTGTPVTIRNVRAGRKKPGLLRQHLTAVRAAAQLGCAQVQGDSIGSKEVTFAPGATPAPGTYRFSVGTAGSATLVLQTVLPALLTGQGPVTLLLEGGTHNPSAPPFDFLEKSFLPLVNRIGPKVVATLERHGFYPAGGGRFSVRVDPASRLCPLELDSKPTPVSLKARAVVAGLPLHIAEREIEVLARSLKIEPQYLHTEELRSAYGPGNVVFVEACRGEVTEVFSGFGKKGVKAQSVAKELAREVGRWLKAAVPVGEHLADQLILLLALGGGGRFETVPLSLHSLTQAHVIGQLLESPIAVTETPRGTVVVEVARDTSMGR